MKKPEYQNKQYKGPSKTGSFFGEGIRHAPSTGSPCSHDYENAARVGRSWYECPKCGEDISLAWILWMEANVMDDLRETKQGADDGR